MNNNQKILVLGASMAMPREELRYEETWVFKLQETLAEYHFIDTSQRASTSQRLVRNGGWIGKGIGPNILEYYNPNIIITQIGVTECAPRLLKQNGITERLIKILSYRIQSIIYRFLKKHKIRSPKNAIVSEENFKNNWENFIERSIKLNTKIIIIKISAPANTAVQKNPYLPNQIKKYNAIYDVLAKKYKNITTIDPFPETEIKKYFIDEFHINNDGHDIIVEKLVDKILS